MDYMKRRFVVGPKSSDQADRYARGWAATFAERADANAPKCASCGQVLDSRWIHFPQEAKSGCRPAGCVVVREDLVE